MMGKSMAARLQRYAAEIVGLSVMGSDSKSPEVISEAELREMMDSLEDGTILSVKFVKGGDGDE